MALNRRARHREFEARKFPPKLKTCIECGKEFLSGGAGSGGGCKKICSEECEIVRTRRQSGERRKAPEAKRKHLESSKRWYYENRERVSTVGKKRYQRDKDRILAVGREWRRRNKEKRAIYVQEYQYWNYEALSNWRRGYNEELSSMAKFANLPIKKIKRLKAVWVPAFQAAVEDLRKVMAETDAAQALQMGSSKHE
jgi:hypothetical protein